MTRAPLHACDMCMWYGYACGVRVTCIDESTLARVDSLVSCGGSTGKAERKCEM